MDRDSKKLVCPECGCENVQIYTEIKPCEKINVLGVISSILSFGFLLFNIIMALSTLTNTEFNSAFDYSRIDTAVFWIINIAIPLMIFLVSFATTLILYNLPKAENKFFCCDCKSMDIKTLNVAIYKNPPKE